MRFALLLVRALVLLIAVGVSGLVGIAAELAETTADGAGHCCSDCPVEQSGKECPPGCPSCHCSHGGAVLPPAVASDVGVAFDPLVEETPAPIAAAVPRAPTLPGIYRPPRSDASV